MTSHNRHFFSIRTKLAVFVFLTMMVITAIGLSFVINRDLDRLHTDILNETHAYARFLNQDFIKILDTGSIDIAADLTDRLRSFPVIQGIVLYNTERVPIYEYRKPGIDRLLPASEGRDHHHEFFDNALTLMDEVSYKGAAFGNSFMQVSTASLTIAYDSIIEQALVITLAAISSSLLLIMLLQHYFSQPILTLASALRRTGESQDHTLQLAVTQKDEIGDLFVGFNSMQEKIQQANRKLKLSNERRDMALSVANDGIWDWNIDSDTITFDDRYYTIAGYDPTDFPHAFVEWEKRVHPDHLKSVIAAIEDYLAGELDAFDIEFLFLCKDDTYMWIR
jgi:methyl-accepting chemotaxis protein